MLKLLSARNESKMKVGVIKVGCCCGHLAWFLPAKLHLIKEWIGKGHSWADFHWLLSFLRLMYFFVQKYYFGGKDKKQQLEKLSISLLKGAFPEKRLNPIDFAFAMGPNLQSSRAPLFSFSAHYPLALCL